MKRMVAAAVVLLLALAPGVWAEQEALQAVKTRVDNVLKVLRNPAFKGPKGEKEKEARIVSEADKLFDYVELSKRTLGLSWNKLSQEQRKEFVSLYKKRLQDTYIDRITAYTNEKVDFTEAVPIGGGAVEVRSAVTTKQGQQVPIYYRTMNEGGEWRVYDVIIEGVSLIANYRSQFREIMANQGADGLLATLRKREGG